MSSSAWKYALASVVGTSHLARGAPCQDAIGCRIVAGPDAAPILIAVAADGAGSALCSELGAKLACSVVLAEVATFFDGGRGVREITADFAAHWLDCFRSEVVRRADADGLSSRDFACTILAAVVGVECAAFIQVGDGAIVVSRQSEPGEYGWVFWPARGEYANSTYFATDDAMREHLSFAIAEGRVDEIALFTDGLQPIALHYESRTAHAPFFRPFFAAVRLAPEGGSEVLSASIATFLGSRPVNERTDDDKTLMVATRRQGGERCFVAEAAVGDSGHVEGV